MSIKYLCDIAPGGICPDCTNDGPLCEFDTCFYEEQIFGETDQRMKASFDSVMKKMKSKEEKHDDSNGTVD